MLNTVNKLLRVIILLCLPVAAGAVLAQESPMQGDGRTLNKQEVLNLISNKKVTYFTAAATSVSSVTEGSLQITFTKSEESGGTLVAYASRSSSSGKWHVDDSGRLVREYEMVKWGNKPFRSSIVEKNGKYFVRFGAAEDHEIVKIE